MLGSAPASAPPATWSSRDQETLRNLQSKVVESPAASVRERIRIVHSEEDRFLARRYLTERLVSREQHLRLPEVLIGPQDTTVLALRDDGSPSAVCSASGKRAPVLSWCLRDPDSDPLAGSAALNTLLSQRGLSEISLDPRGVQELDWLPSGFLLDARHEKLSLLSRSLRDQI
jgi:hypothetical protein